MIGAPEGARRGRWIAVAAAILITVLLTAGWRPLVHTVLPWLAGAIQLWSPSLVLHELRVVRRGADHVMSATFSIAAPLRLRGGGRMYPDPRGRINVSVSAAKVALPLVCLFVPALLWPTVDRREHVARSALCAAAAPVLLAIDVPIVLPAMVWDTAVQQRPDLAGSVLQPLGQFMESGGRIVTGVVAAALVVAVSRGWSDRQA